MRFIALLVCALGCLKGKAINREKGLQSDSKLDNKEAMRKFSNFLYREGSRRTIENEEDDDDDDDDDIDIDHIGMDLVTSFFWGQEKGVVMEVGALDGVHLSQSMPLLDLHWKRILVEGSPVYQQRMKRSSPDAVTFNAAICNNDRNSHLNESFHYGKINR